VSAPLSSFAPAASGVVVGAHDVQNVAPQVDWLLCQEIMPLFFIFFRV
jgi:hypothetical protein